MENNEKKTDGFKTKLKRFKKYFSSKIATMSERKENIFMKCRIHYANTSYM